LSFFACRNGSGEINSTRSTNSRDTTAAANKRVTLIREYTPSSMKGSFEGILIILKLAFHKNKSNQMNQCMKVSDYSDAAFITL